MSTPAQAEKEALHGSGETGSPKRAKVDAQNPWPGPDAYDEASSPFFKGRNSEAGQLLRLIRLAPLTALYGKSGLGKTSLLQAGLFPLLRREHYLPVLLRLDFAEGKKEAPLEQVKKRLQAALAHERAEYPAMTEGESLWEYLHRKDAEFWSTDNFPLTPVLVFDQFEELFSRTGGNAELISEVFHELADLIENRIPPELACEAAIEKRARLDLLSQHYCIVLSFREDFLPDIRTWEKQVPSLLRNYLRLEPMSRMCAIEATEASGSAVLDKGVAASIVDLVGKRDQQTDNADGAEMTIEPVLLSLCCTQLNLRRAPGKLIDKDLVEKTGQDILESFYRSALEDPEVRGEPDVAHFIETYLIQGDRFRGDYPKQEALDEHKLSAVQLAALTDRIRLLRIVPRSDTARIELIHDRLVPIVRKARDQRRSLELQEEQKRRAEEAQAERDKEREHNKALLHERDVARWSFALALGAAVLCLVLAVWAWKEKHFAEILRQNSLISWETSRLAEGKLALGRGREPLEQTMYRALAAYRLGKSNGELSQTRSAGLSALEYALDRSGHLSKIVRYPGLVPTPGLAYSPDGKVLAVGSEDGLIWLLDAENYQSIGTLDCNQQSPADSVWALAFNADGTRLAAGYIKNDTQGRGLICVFDVGQRKAILKWSSMEAEGKPGNVFTIAYGTRGGHEFVAFGGTDKMLHEMDVNTGKPLHPPIPTGAEVITVDISRDGHKIAAGGDDKMIRIWDTSDLGPDAKPAILTGHEDIVQQVVFSSTDSNVLFSGSNDGIVSVWNVKERCATEKSNSPTAVFWGLAINKEGILAVASGDGFVRLFRPSKVGTACPANNDAPAMHIIREGALMGHSGEILAVAFNRDGDRLASAGLDRSIHIWYPSAGGFSSALLTWASGSSHGEPKAVAVSPDGKLIAVGDSEGNISLWSRPVVGSAPEIRDELQMWKAHNAGVHCLLFLQEGGRLEIISGGEDGILRRWDASTRSQIGGDMVNSNFRLRSVALSPEGKTLAIGSAEGSVRLWDLATGSMTLTIDPPKDLKNYSLSSAGFSSDGRYLAIGSNFDDLRIVDLHNPDSGNHFKERNLSGQHMGIASLAHSQHAWLLSAGDDGSILEWQQTAMGQPETKSIWKPDQFEYRMGFRGARNPVPILAMDVSDDGKLILASGRSGQIQLWDGLNHELISDQFTAHQSQVVSVALAPDESFFVTADKSEIFVWPGPNLWADVLCSKLGWNMSRQHWNEWISSKIPYEEQCPGLPVEADEERLTGH